jgi:hypothetical protein
MFYMTGLWSQVDKWEEIYLMIGPMGLYYKTFLESLLISQYKGR